MEDELSLDNILGADEIENLFVDDDTQETSPPEENAEDNPKKETES